MRGSPTPAQAQAKHEASFGCRTVRYVLYVSPNVKTLCPSLWRDFVLSDLSRTDGGPAQQRGLLLFSSIIISLAARTLSLCTIYTVLSGPAGGAVPSLVIDVALRKSWCATSRLWRRRCRGMRQHCHTTQHSMAWHSLHDFRGCSQHLLRHQQRLKNCCSHGTR